MKQLSSYNLRVPQLTPDEAAALVKNGDTVTICGAGGGITEPTKLILALAERYQKSGSPENLTLLVSSGPGDRADRGVSPLAQQGLVKCAVQGHWGQSPRLAEMCQRGEIEGYNFPMGVMAQMYRAVAAGQPGVLSRVGMGTFMDPRQQGCKCGPKTTKDLVKLIEIDGEEWLLYPAIQPNVAFLRGTTADTNGYITMEDEITFQDVCAMAQATRNSGGIVIVQVQKVVAAGTLHPKDVRIPGIYVDAIVVVPDQPQLYNAPVNRFLSGDYTAETSATACMPLTERKVIARRALMEVQPGNVGNIGVGISDGIGVVASEEGVSDSFVLTVETGAIGGVSAQGIFFGANVNAKALMEMPTQFDFYHGGGLDISFLSFAEVDRHGNVNVHQFNGQLMGTGGFADISQNSRKIVFNGTLNAGGLKTEVRDGSIRILQEGRFKKFLPEVAVTFNGADAVKRGQEVLYVTERCVFRLTAGGLELSEIAPGIDLEQDIIEQMGFRPLISEHLITMDARLFDEARIGIGVLWKQRFPQWYGS